MKRNEMKRAYFLFKLNLKGMFLNLRSAPAPVPVRSTGTGAQIRSTIYKYFSNQFPYIFKIVVFTAPHRTPFILGCSSAEK